MQVRSACERVALRLGQQLMVEGAGGFASMECVVAVAAAAAAAAGLQALTGV